MKKLSLLLSILSIAGSTFGAALDQLTCSKGHDETDFTFCTGKIQLPKEMTDIYWKRLTSKSKDLNISLTPEVIYISVPDQTLTLYVNEEVAQSYVISTSKNPPSNVENSYGTPTGFHFIQDMIGGRQPLGTMFESREIIRNEEGNVERFHTSTKSSHIVTRILRLGGLESDNSNTHARYIYIHATRDEKNLGKPKSHGCINMTNLDIIDLFNRVHPEAVVLIETCKGQECLVGILNEEDHRIIQSLSS